MKKIYILAILIGIGFSTTAQNFVFSTDQHLDKEMTIGFNSNNYIRFTTTDPEEITFQYERISNTMPQDWDLSLCDYTSCYIGVPANGSMTEITLAEATNGTDGFFNLTVNHKGITGEGKVVLYVFDSNDHERGDTVSWQLSFDGTVSIDEIEANKLFKVYPNPATDVLNITSEGHYTGAIFNSIGKRVLLLEGDKNETVNISNLESGIYFISCQDEKGYTFNRQIIIQ